jgi:dsDNA-specific endonuclease/ATPase MutS2
MRTFDVGDHVHVPSLGTGTVREVRNRRRYVVEVKGRLLQVQASQLQSADPPRKTRVSRKGAAAAAAAEQKDADAGARTVRTIDLHGKTVVEAIEALDAFVNDAALDGADELHVIHGRSGTRLKSAVHARLAEMPAVRSFRIDAGNPGVTIAVL